MHSMPYFLPPASARIASIRPLMSPRSALTASSARFDGVAEFGESACLRGGLGQFEAKYLMLLALAHAGRLGKYGA